MLNAHLLCSCSSTRHSLTTASSPAEHTSGCVRCTSTSRTAAECMLSLTPTATAAPDSALTSETEPSDAPMATHAAASLPGARSPVPAAATSMAVMLALPPSVLGAAAASARNVSTIAGVAHDGGGGRFLRPLERRLLSVSKASIVDSGSAAGSPTAGCTGGAEAAPDAAAVSARGRLAEWAAPAAAPADAAVGAFSSALRASSRSCVSRAITRHAASCWYSACASSLRAVSSCARSS
mmetsp:Transcript_4353/g.11288  ORF Transcript_4353/g.11288 Transcript_4353/m.11288 type:complete len:238 (-) Transcript_4353:307-1020(-)